MPTERSPIRSDMPLAGVELGGTKCICILGTGADDVRATIEIPTREPGPTLDAIRSTLAEWTFSALGIASFGPLDLDPGSARYGRIVNTPKPGWNDVDLTTLAAGTPFAIDTDVNGAALAEGRWGGARGLESWAYVTVGTGVGVGSIVGGRPIRGMGHSEAGHLRVPREAGDSFSGACRYHGDCVEGLASGNAIAARAGRPGAELAASDDAVWRPVAAALAALCHNLMLTSLPQRILIGGGVMQGNPALLPAIRSRLSASLAGYGTAPRLAGAMANYLVPPMLGPLAGPLGAIALVSG